VETQAQQACREVLNAVAEIERDIDRFERSPRPLDKTGLAAIRQRITGVQERLKAELWTSYEASERIKAATSRLAKLEQE